MEIVEPRKIYENWRSASVHEIRTKCLNYRLLQTVILYINIVVITNIPTQGHNFYIIYPLY